MIGLVPAQRWLNALGDPYDRTGADLDGRVAIDWGVYGIPETFVIDRDGTIAHKHTRRYLDGVDRELRKSCREEAISS